MTNIDPKKTTVCGRVGTGGTDGAGDNLDEDLSSCSSEGEHDEAMDEALAVGGDATMANNDSEDDDDDDDEDDDGDEESDQEGDGDAEDTSGVFIPGKRVLADDEELVMDRSAYIVYQQATTAAPCLSFDILRDQLGNNRADVFPLTAYIVAGTQAEPHEQNHLLCMNMWNMHRLSDTRGDDDDDDDDNAEDVDGNGQPGAVDRKPKLNVAYIPHSGAVNRVRVQDLGNGRKICASWSDNKSVYLTDISEAVAATEKADLLARFVKNKLAPSPLFKFSGHKAEGFGLDWSPVVVGQLASADCYRNIHVWRMADEANGGGSRWKVDERPLVGHTASVEDVQWSPNEASVLASCSVDRTLRVFDIRANPAKACMLTVEQAHASDVNVISWNRLEQAFLLSGGDDGAINVWDLRQFKTGRPVSQFGYHKAPITSIEWHPTDSTVFAASSEDDCITLWDLAVERDDEATQPAEAEPSGDVDDLPPQLLFIHQGQQEVKECHWHPQMPGLLLSTAHSGFNIFRTISV